MTTSRTCEHTWDDVAAATACGLCGAVRLEADLARVTEERDAAIHSAQKLAAKLDELSECLRESNAMVGREREACARTCERRDFHELCDADRARWAIHGASSVAADIRARR